MHYLILLQLHGLTHIIAVFTQARLLDTHKTTYTYVNVDDLGGLI